MIIINETKQEYFDKTVEHLARQGHRSINAEGQCRYRMPTGEMCAFGIFIPDELYSEDLEGMSLDILVNKHKVVFTGEVFLGFAYDLQHIHDCTRGGLATLKSALYGFARQTGLDASKVELITQWA